MRKVDCNDGAGAGTAAVRRRAVSKSAMLNLTPLPRPDLLTQISTDWCHWYHSCRSELTHYGCRGLPQCKGTNNKRSQKILAGCRGCKFLPGSLIVEEIASCQYINTQGFGLDWYFSILNKSTHTAIIYLVCVWRLWPNCSKATLHSLFLLGSSR